MGSKSKQEGSAKRKIAMAILTGLFVGLGVSVFNVAWRNKKAELQSQTDSLHATFTMQLSQKARVTPHLELQPLGLCNVVCFRQQQSEDIICKGLLNWL